MSLAKQQKELVSILTKIKSERLMLDFLLDILTPSEFDDIVARWQIIKRLKAGEHQRDIAKNLHVSIAKITRGSRELLDKHGGFSQILELQKKKKF